MKQEIEETKDIKQENQAMKKEIAQHQDIISDLGTQLNFLRKTISNYVKEIDNLKNDHTITDALDIEIVKLQEGKR